MMCRRAFPFVLLLLLFSGLISNAQVHPVENELRQNSRVVPVLPAPEPYPGRTVVFLPTPFAKANLIDPAKAAALRGTVIESVELVYTTFATSPDFDQQNLNKRRLQELYRLLPEAFTNSMVQWQLTGQNKATVVDSARNLFHGFVITYRPAPTPESMLEEWTAIETMLKMTAKERYRPSEPGSTSTSTSTTTSSSSTTTTSSSSTGITMTGTFKGDIDSMDAGTRQRYTALRIAMHHLGNREGVTLDSNKCRISKVTTDYSIVELHYRLMNHKRSRFDTIPNTVVDTTTILVRKPFDKFPDTIIYNVMRRNPWDNMVIICDVTGSMSPYTAQVFLWLDEAVKAGRIKSFVFFNDGDGKNDKSKKMGKVGGLYPIKASSIDSIKDKARTAMRNGDGGDCPENNIEALLYAAARNDTNTSYIMIADNLATPRDLELLKGFTQPVHIIACSARGGINPEYLKIARYTKGSVHTLHYDFYGLGDLEDGAVIHIGKESFHIKGNNFFSGDGYGSGSAR